MRSYSLVQRSGQLLLAILGALEALLLARIVLQLFAARPSNPLVHGLLALTQPFVAPFSALDSRQPRFGAILELSTLALALVVLLLLGTIYAISRRRT